MRFAGERVIPSEAQDPEVLPNTKGVRYPQDQIPAGDFGPDGIHPTDIPLLRNKHMYSPHGGIAFANPFVPIKQYEDGKYRPYHPANPNRRA